MLSKFSVAVLPVVGGHLDRVQTRGDKRRREAQKAVGSRHSCKARAEDVAERIRRVNNNRVAQRRSVAGPEAPGQEADYTYRQVEQDSRLDHQWEKQSRSLVIWGLEVAGSGFHHRPGERHGLVGESRSLQEEEASGDRVVLSDRLLHQGAADRRTLGFLEGDGPCRLPDLTS